MAYFVFALVFVLFSFLLSFLFVSFRLRFVAFRLISLHFISRNEMKRKTFIVQSKRVQRDGMDYTRVKSHHPRKESQSLGEREKVPGRDRFGLLRPVVSIRCFQLFGMTQNLFEVSQEFWPRYGGIF